MNAKKVAKGQQANRRFVATAQAAVKRMRERRSTLGPGPEAQVLTVQIKALRRALRRRRRQLQVY